MKKRQELPLAIAPHPAVAILVLPDRINDRLLRKRYDLALLRPHAMEDRAVFVYIGPELLIGLRKELRHGFEWYRPVAKVVRFDDCR